MEKEPSIELINLIDFQSGENDFDKPILDAIKIANKTLISYDKIVFYFMTDGIWTYPETAIKQIN